MSEKYPEDLTRQLPSWMQEAGYILIYREVKRPDKLYPNVEHRVMVTQLSDDEYTNVIKEWRGCPSLTDIFELSEEIKNGKE